MTMQEKADSALKDILTARDKIHDLERVGNQNTRLHLSLDALHRAEALLREACEEQIGFRLP